MSSDNNQKAANTLERFLSMNPSDSTVSKDKDVLVLQDTAETITNRKFGRRPGKLIYIAKTEKIKDL